MRTEHRGVPRVAIVVTAAILAAALAAILAAGCSTTRDRTGPPAGRTPIPTGASPTATPTAVDPSPVEPPPAWLVLPDGQRVSGKLGSWTLDGAGSEAPWLPASALATISVQPGTAVVIEPGGGLGIGAWRADLATAVDPTGAEARWLAGRETDEPPLGQIELPPLPAGSWVVRATLGLAGGRGDAAYSWAVEVAGG